MNVVATAVLMPQVDVRVGRFGLKALRQHVWMVVQERIGGLSGHIHHVLERVGDEFFRKKYRRIIQHNRSLVEVPLTDLHGHGFLVWIVGGSTQTIRIVEMKSKHGPERVSVVVDVGTRPLGQPRVDVQGHEIVGRNTKLQVTVFHMHLLKPVRMRSKQSK
jgi:hypothetical protein